MSLQTLVKAGNITNLSDARYCAGMGVEIIGFPLGKSNPQALEPSKIKEIMGWLAGVQMALELDEQLPDETTWQAINDLAPGCLQVPLSIAETVKQHTSIPLLIVSETLPAQLEEGDILLYTGNFQENAASVTSYCQQHPVILSGEKIEASTVLQVLKTIQPYGIELKGGTEISPGLKSFEQLSEMLELLEVDE